MESTLVSGLHDIGEAFNIDSETDCHKLKSSYSTGMLAARSIAEGFSDPPG